MGQSLMQAAVLKSAKTIELKEVPIPEIGPDDILMRVSNCGICGSDIHSYATGMFVQPDQIMGHEFMGVAHKVGENVKGIEIGDRVIGFHAGACGVCDACTRGEPLLCAELFKDSTGYGRPGAFAEYVKIENARRSVIKLSDKIDDLSAAMIEPLSVGCGAVEEAQVKPGDKVVVLGAGMIGNAILQAAKAAGAAEVIVIEVSETRLRLAKESGADAIFNARDGDALDWVIEKFGSAPYHYQDKGGNADVVFEAAGSPITIQQSLEMVRPRGTVCYVGLPEGAVPLDTTKIVHKMPRVVGSLGGSFIDAIKLLESGKAKTTQLVTHRFPLSQIKEAFDVQMNADDTVKVMIDIGG